VPRGGRSVQPRPCGPAMATAAAAAPWLRRVVDRLNVAAEALVAAAESVQACEHRLAVAEDYACEALASLEAALSFLRSGAPVSPQRDGDGHQMTGEAELPPTAVARLGHQLVGQQQAPNPAVAVPGMRVTFVQRQTAQSAAAPSPVGGQAPRAQHGQVPAQQSQDFWLGVSGQHTFDHEGFWRTVQTGKQQQAQQAERTTLRAADCMCATHDDSESLRLMRVMRFARQDYYRAMVDADMAATYLRVAPMREWQCPGPPRAARTI